MDLTRRRFLTHTACATAALGAVNPAALGAVLPTDPICSVRRGVTVLPAAADPAGRAVAWVVRDGAALVIDWASRAA
ncbi:MAG: twin-arginine translocation signal domain-containing protein, partial [Acidobacteriota bacterium]